MQCVCIENYFDRLTPPYPTSTLIAEITKANYKMNSEGKLLVNLRSSYDKEIRKIELTNKIRIINVFTCPEVMVGDRFLVYHINKTTNLWLRIGSKRLFTTHHKVYLDLRHVVFCPFCRKQLSNTFKGKYCFNPECKATIEVSIHRFLNIATTVRWTYDDLTIFAILIHKGILRRVIDLYELTPDIINELDIKIDIRLKEGQTIGDYIVDKINQTKKTVTIYNYLQSLNIPNKYNWQIYKDKLEEKYNRILPFYDDVINNRNFLKVPHPMHEFMTKETHLFLYHYFGSREFYEQLCKLINKDVFATCDAKILDV